MTDKFKTQNRAQQRIEKFRLILSHPHGARFSSQIEKLIQKYKGRGDKNLPPTRENDKTSSKTYLYLSCLISLRQKSYAKARFFVSFLNFFSRERSVESLSNIVVIFIFLWKLFLPFFCLNCIDCSGVEGFRV